jgi:hypothetical protein
MQSGMTEPDRSAALARARDYPYPLPAHSYRWRGGKVLDFDPASTAGRVPVLAVGSNQAPAQLTRKFGQDPAQEIPVQRCHLKDFDTVYSAHIASYGSVPAMLQAAPGATVTLFVNWLSEKQLAVMHPTELGSGNYHYGRLDDIDLTLEDGGGALQSVHAYISRRGHVALDGDAVALAAVPAVGRRRPARTTAQMLEHAHARLAPDHALDAFILRLIDDAPYRRDCVAALSSDAGSFAVPYAIVA